MASVINTNMASLYAQKNLSGAQNALSTSVERLSSGLRINRAKDDAAGLGISEKIKSQVTSLNQGLRNANDAISMVQTAEGSLSEVSSILQRMKELSVQARNDSLSTTQRSFISDELVALKNEINSIAERTTFNDLSLLKNALRTQVSVPALADATKITNGASLLSGVSVSGLSVSNTNVGTYTLTTGTQAPIANQVSEAAGKFGGSEVDVITVAGTWLDTESITATVAITGGATITATYAVSAATDFTVMDSASSVGTAGSTVHAHYNIAKALAAELNRKSQEATGVALGITAIEDKIYIGGATDSVSLTTSTTTTSANGTVAVTSPNPIENAIRVISINAADGVEGNKFILSVGDKEYSVVAGYGANAAAIRDAVASNLTALLEADYLAAGVTPSSGDITLSDVLGLGTADISLRVVRLADGEAVTNQASTVSAASLTSSSVDRTITLNDFDIVEGRKVTVQVGNPDYYTEFSTVVGASDTKATVGDRLQALIHATHGNTTDDNAGVITMAAAGAFGMSRIAVTVSEMVEGDDVVASSTVSSKNLARADRTITINQSDLSPGNVVSVNIGEKEYAVKVREGELAADVAYRLSSLIDDDFAPVAGTVSGPVSGDADGALANAGTAVLTFSTGMTAGDSITIGGLKFTATKDITAAQTAKAFAGLASGSTSDADGEQYGYYTGSFVNATTALTTATTVTVTAGAAIDLGLSNTTSGAAVAERIDRGVTVSSNVITLGAGSLQGLSDISVSVKTITDPGKLTLTANADTGIAGTSQTIDVGTIAAGSAKTFDFDRLGVSFTLNNANTTAVNAQSFEAFTPKANTLVVESAMDGEALFQVGAGTRDNVVIDGFKDIRITGYNNNANTSEKLVFDNINTTLNTIAQNTTESLSEANFATLENQIEAAITTISDFRSYLGAQQNRIEFAISNIQAQSENLTAANSRIVDTDYAAETANLTKTQIMQQAATAMLAQANQMPNVILALLK